MPYPIKWFKSKQNKCRQFYTNTHYVFDIIMYIFPHFRGYGTKRDNLFWRRDAKKLLTITLTITFTVQTINITITCNFSSSVMQMLKKHFGGLMPSLSQNIFGWSKLFVQDQNMCRYQTFWDRPKHDFHFFSVFVKGQRLFGPALNVI